MSLLSRAPRQVYRVLDEEEFLLATSEDDFAGFSLGEEHARRSRVPGLVAIVALTVTAAALVIVTRHGLSGKSLSGAQRKRDRVAVAADPRKSAGMSRNARLSSGAPTRSRLHRARRRSARGTRSHRRERSLASGASVARLTAERAAGSASGEPHNEFGFER